MKTNAKSAMIITLLIIIALLTGSCKKNRFNPFAVDTLPDFSVIMDNGETVNALTLYGTSAVICTFNTKDGRSAKMLSMLQPLHNGQCIVHDSVRRHTINTHHCTNAAGIVLEFF